MITDRHPMGVPPEIAQDGGRAAEGRLSIDHPVGLEEGVDEAAPLRRVAEVRTLAPKIEFARIVRAAYCLDILPTKDATQDLHGQEEAGVSRVDPAVVLRGDTSCRHDAMDMGMPDQRLSPRVQDAEHPDLGAEMSRVSRDLAQRGGARPEEPRVQLRAVPIGHGQQRMGQGEHGVHIRHVE